MKISTIYIKYKIPKNLQEHQLRVAVVASLICDNFKEKIDKDTVITACLFHDMGNIIKFNFNLFPEFLEPEGREYWESVKVEFIEKYGKDEHLATHKIVEELDISQRVLDIIESYGFMNSDKTLDSKDFELKIASYADHRVSPHGIVSMHERHSDAKKRYVNVKKAKWKEDEFDHMAEQWEKIEKQIFTKCKITPNDITDQNTKALIQKLMSYNISVS